MQRGHQICKGNITLAVYHNNMKCSMSSSFEKILVENKIFEKERKIKAPKTITRIVKSFEKYSFQSYQNVLSIPSQYGEHFKSGKIYYRLKENNKSTTYICNTYYVSILFLGLCISILCLGLSKIFTLFRLGPKYTDTCYTPCLFRQGTALCLLSVLSIVLSP